MSFPVGGILCKSKRLRKKRKKHHEWLIGQINELVCEELPRVIQEILKISSKPVYDVIRLYKK